MTLSEARDILELGLTATRQEITRAYRRAARRWHPDRAPEGREEEYRAHMQQVNAAYQRLKEFLENYRFHLEDKETGEDVEEWWQERFYTGVWGRPPQEHRDSQKKGAKKDSGPAATGKDKKGSF
ncbi:MAG: J domain-containing protein [Syntrophobacterales bacterium]|jgi:curved DNA-binding protein CbpA